MVQMTVFAKENWFVRWAAQNSAIQRDRGSDAVVSTILGKALRSEIRLKIRNFREVEPSTKKVDIRYFIM
jgi:hypothetical protein